MVVLYSIPLPSSSSCNSFLVLSNENKATASIPLMLTVCLISGSDTLTTSNEQAPSPSTWITWSLITLVPTPASTLKASSAPAGTPSATTVICVPISWSLLSKGFVTLKLINSGKGLMTKLLYRLLSCYRQERNAHLLIEFVR